MEQEPQTVAPAGSPASKDAGEAARREAARLMGLAKTEKKAASSRENGKAGGRPKGAGMTAEAKAKIGAANRARWAEKKAAAAAEAPPQ